jgi:hypothetical protein
MVTQASAPTSDAFLVDTVARMIRLVTKDTPLRLAAASVPGGVGKTTLICHMAWLAAEMGLRVLVLDRDSQARAWDRLVGADCPPHQRTRARFSKGCVVLAGPSAMTVRPEDLSKYDLVLVDSRCDEYEALPSGVDELDMVVLPVRDEESTRELVLLRKQIEDRTWRGRAPHLLVVWSAVNLQNQIACREMEARRGELLARKFTVVPGSVPRAICIENAKERSPAWRVAPRDPPNLRAAKCLRGACLSALSVAAWARMRSQ